MKFLKGKTMIKLMNSPQCLQELKVSKNRQLNRIEDPKFLIKIKCTSLMKIKINWIR